MQGMSLLLPRSAARLPVFQIGWSIVSRVPRTVRKAQRRQFLLPVFDAVLVQAG